MWRNMDEIDLREGDDRIRTTYATPARRTTCASQISSPFCNSVSQFPRRIRQRPLLRCHFQFQFLPW